MQRAELAEKNGRAFVWLDDPGLQFVFSAMSGYGDVKAKADLVGFFSGIDGPRGIHLCGNPDWDFLFSLPLEIISFNAYAFGDIVATYPSVRRFIEAGNMVSWGIVPTLFEEFTEEDVTTIAGRLIGHVASAGRKRRAEGRHLPEQPHRPRHLQPPERRQHHDR